MKSLHAPLPIILLTALAVNLMSAHGAEPAAPGPDNTPATPSGSPAAPSGTTSPAPAADVSARFTYTLHRAESPTPEEENAYKKITAIMDKACDYYNKYTTGLHKHLTVDYSPGTPTADGSNNGHIRIGKRISSTFTCMHEIAHTLGVGTSPKWHKLSVHGVFTGRHATEKLRELTGNPNAVLHADRAHFWPYGLNFGKEVKSGEDLIRHCKMVQAICQDLRETR